MKSFKKRINLPICDYSMRYLQIEMFLIKQIANFSMQNFILQKIE